MGNNILVKNGLRLIFLLFLQIVVFKRLFLGWEQFPYLHAIVYPLFLMLLPFETPRPLSMAMGFVVGLFIDLFYDSLGVHAGALVATAFARDPILKWLEPRDGYNVKGSPTKSRLGWPWFVQYAAIMMFIHLFVYFSLESFTFYYFKRIMLNLISSLFVSMFFVILYTLVFNPEE